MDGGGTQDSKATTASAKTKTNKNFSDCPRVSEFLENAREKRAYKKKWQALTEEFDALKKEVDANAAYYRKLARESKAIDRESRKSRKRKRDGESGSRQQLRAESGHSSPNEFILSQPVTKYVNNGHALRFLKVTSNAGRNGNNGGNGISMEQWSAHSAFKPKKVSPSLPVSKYGLNGHGIKFHKRTSNGIRKSGVTVKVKNGISSFESLRAMLLSKKIRPLPPASEYELNGLDLSSKATRNGIGKAGDAEIRYDKDGIFKVPTGFPYLPIRKRYH